MAGGAKGVVFESLAWSLDHSGTNPAIQESLRKFRPEQTRIVGQDLGMPVRVHDKGISRAVAAFRDYYLALDPNDPASGTGFRQKAADSALNTFKQGLSPDRIVFAGPEAAATRVNTSACSRGGSVRCWSRETVRPR